MIHVVDGSEGRFGAGQYPEPTALLLPQQSREHICVLTPIDGVAVRHGRAVHVVHAASRSQAPLRTPGEYEGSLLHAWSRRSAVWALDRASDQRVALTLLESPARKSAAVTRVVDRLKSATSVHVVDKVDAARWIDAGLPADIVDTRLPEANVIQGNIADMAHRCGLPVDREELRALLRAEAEEFLVFPIAGSWSEWDAQRFVFLLGMLRINGTRASAVVPASAWRLVGARLFREQSRLGTRVCVIDGPMSPWLPACDAAFLDAQRPREALVDFRATGAARVLTMAAEAMGVPVAVAPGSVLEFKPQRAPSVADELRPLLEVASRLATLHQSNPVAMAESHP